MSRTDDSVVQRRHGSPNGSTVGVERRLVVKERTDSNGVIIRRRLILRNSLPEGSCSDAVNGRRAGGRLWRVSPGRLLYASAVGTAVQSPDLPLCSPTSE